MQFTQYDEKKATQVAAYFLSKLSNRSSKLKLMKLMYIADRESFRVCGEPITYDEYYSMQNGPVLSKTYDIMKGDSEHSYWDDYIIQRNTRELVLINNPGIGKLNQEEIEILDQIFAKFGSCTPSELRNITHKFPEYVETNSSKKIDYQQIMHGVGIPQKEIEQLLKSYSDAIDI